MSAQIRPVVWFVLGFAILQAVWVITVPPFRGIDEFDHAYRAASVAQGEWVAGGVPDDGRGLLVKVPPDIVAAAHAQCAELDYTGPDNCSPAGEAGDGLVYVASAAATYHPLFYWVVGSVGRPFSGAGSLYAMRVATALLSLVFVALAAWASSRWSSRWPVVGLVVALTPVLTYSTTVVSPNGLEMAAGTALWCALLRLRVEPDEKTARRLVVIAAVSAAVLSTLRYIGPGWVLLIVATVLCFDPAGLWNAVRRHPRHALLGTALVTLSAVNMVVWYLTAATGTGMAADGGGDEKLTAFYPVVWALQSIAAFPYRDQPGPPLVYGIVGALAISVLLASLRRATRRSRVVVLASLLVTLTFPVALTIATMACQGIIWQGRYGLPYAVGFVLLATTVIAERDSPIRLPLAGAGAAALALGIGLGASLVKVRAAELADNAASVGDAAWHTPSPVLLYALAVAGYATLVGAWAAASRDGDTTGRVELSQV